MPKKKPSTTIPNDPIPYTTTEAALAPRGRRDNDGKLSWSLLPWDALREIARVYQWGAAHYGPRNWERGLSYTETWDALQRHAIAWLEGEDTDPQTGCSHMAHVAWNALALVAFQARGRTDLDDRTGERA